MKNKLINITLLILLHGMCAGQQHYLPIPIGQPHVPPTIYWTWNSTYMGTSGTLSSGNLKYTVGLGGDAVVIATLPGGTTGKSGADYYYEVTINTLGNNQSIGLENSLAPNLNQHMGQDVHGYGYYSIGSAAGSWLAGSLSFSPPPADIFSTGDVVGILFKGTTNQIVMYRLHAGLTTLEATFPLAAGSYYPAMSIYGGISTANFGASPWQLSGAPFGGTGWAN